MSRKIFEANRVISKLTASMLILGCVFLSSPGILLADTSPTDSPLTTDTVPANTTTQNTTTQSPPTFDIQPVQPDQAVTDTTTLTATTTSPTDASLTTDPSSTNTDTGSTSQNSSTTNVNNQTDITNQNFAQVFNDSTLSADTGSNSANYNTGSGIITTQKAKGDGQLLNVINKNNVQAGGNATASPDSASNQNTGSNSSNQSTTNINNQLTVKNVNESNVINRVTADINSGNNNSSFNTGHGITTTGDADLGLNFFSLQNTNLVGNSKFYANLQNIYNTYNGNIDLSQELANGISPLSSLLLNASNNSTGSGSSNQAIVNVNDQTSITNQNTGNLNNEVDAKITSGKNKSNYNTGTGSIATGKVNSSVNMMNFMNSNITSGNWMLKTLNVFGDWTGDLHLPSMPVPDLVSVTSPSSSALSQNSNTGSDSSNSSNTNINNSSTTTNNNNAVITNNITIKTDAGANDASYNGGSGVVKVGQANAETNEMNVANLNVTGKSWWLVVINRFGNWNGTAVGSPTAVAINSTGISTVLTPQQSGVNTINNPTGVNSDNSAGVTINHTTDLTNTNQANILNTLNIQAVSGQNEAKYNSGHGYIETGDIRGVNNIINFANANISVGNWVVVVVNVFGNWSGNLVFNTPGSGAILPVGGNLQCPVFNTNTSGNVSSANNSTGAGSQNNSTTTSNTTNTATNTNNADLNNTTNASSTTGQNNANYNTGNGTVSTGGASAGSSVSNSANTNSVSSGQSPGTDSSSSNASTGAGSTNDTTSTSNNSTTATNTNNTTATNNATAVNSTGQNSSNYNTGNGSVDTGWANTFLDLRNQANDNKITIGDLTSDFNPSDPISPGQQVVVPNDNSSTQVCPGVTVVVTPATSSITTGATKQFTATANDPSGNAISPQPTFTWTATGGTIDDNGLFTAGPTAGDYAVTATASYGNQGSANITITASSSGTGGNSGGNTGGNTGGNSGGVSVGGGGGGGFVLSGAGGKKRLRGDWNNDGKVDDLDFSILMALWNKNRTGYIVEDNGNGIVSDIDFSVVMSNWTMQVADISNNKNYKA